MKLALSQTCPSFPLDSIYCGGRLLNRFLCFESSGPPLRWHKNGEPTKEDLTERRSGNGHQSVSAFVSIFFLVNIFKTLFTLYSKETGRM